MLFQGIEPVFGTGEWVVLPNRGNYLRIRASHYRGGRWLYSGDRYVAMRGELYDRQEYLEDIPESDLQPIPKLQPGRC